MGPEGIGQALCLLVEAALGSDETMAEEGRGGVEERRLWRPALGWASYRGGWGRGCRGTGGTADGWLGEEQRVGCGGAQMEC